LQYYYFYYGLALIAQCKISVLATPVTSSNLCKQAPLFTELAFHGAPKELQHSINSIGKINKIDIVTL